MSTTQVSAGASEAGPVDPRPKPARRRRRRGRIVAVAVVVVVAAAGGVVLVVHPFKPKAPITLSPDSSAATALAPITVGSLFARTQENGTLGYAGDYQVLNQASGAATTIPSVGSAIVHGHAIYRVDTEPVILLYGAYVPLYRALSRGKSGIDVRQLNSELVHLGYAKKLKLDPTSEYFGRRTSLALKKMQKHFGLEKTGQLPLSEAVFLPVKAVRVTKVNVGRGANVGAGSPVLEVSSTDRTVSVSLDAGRQSEVKVGNKVNILLPNGKSTKGVVSSVGKVATKSSSGTPTINVQIRPTDPKVTGQLDQAPVQVSIIADSVKNALSVPVNALLALAGGGYAVEVVQADNSRKLIPVTSGLFDDSAGRVQITGDGLSAGQNVVVPTS